MRRLLVSVSFIFLAASSWAVGSGGYTNQVVGTKALSMGNAFTAVADDASAVFFNPAGLSRQDGYSVAVGAAPVVSDTHYTTDSGTGDDMESATPVVPYLYGVSPVGDKWRVGLGVNAPFGLETHWRDDGPLRYVATDSRLQFLGINPVVSYKVRERLSVGGGVVYARVSAKLDSRLNETALNSFLNGAPTLSADGGKSLKGDGGGWGFNLGVLYEPVIGHTFGLSYRSGIKASISGQTRLSGLSNASAFVFGGDSYSTDTKTHLKFPSSLLVGYAYKPGPWTFAVDGEWVGYSVANRTHLTFSETDATRLAILNQGNPTERNWKDSWNLGAGVDRSLGEAFHARAGFFYYPRVIPETTWDPGNPESSRIGYTLGGGWSRGALTVDLAYNFIQFNEKTIHNTVGSSSLATVDGSYKTSASIFMVGLTWKVAGSPGSGEVSDGR